MRKPKIGIVSANCNHGLVYQRIHLPFIHLRDEFDFRFFDLGDLRHSDAFYLDALVFCHPSSEEYLYLAERARYHYGLKVILDIDDLLSDLPPDHPDHGRIHASKIPYLVQSASACVFSTKFLKDRYQQFNKNAHVIENSISKRVYEAYRPMAKPHKNCFIVGWTGAQQHMGDQYGTFKEGLSEFLRKHRDAKAYFHGIIPNEMHQEFGSQIIFEPNYVDFLDYPGVAAAYPFSVCLVGLNKNQFNEAKSDLKLAEMAPHEIPLIASPRSDFIRHAERHIMLYAEDKNPGFSSWERQITWAYENPDKLQEMANKARDYVLSERLSEHAAAKWRQVLGVV